MPSPAFQRGRQRHVAAGQAGRAGQVGPPWRPGGTPCPSGRSSRGKVCASASGRRAAGGRDSAWGRPRTGRHGPWPRAGTAGSPWWFPTPAPARATASKWTAACGSRTPPPGSIRTTSTAPARWWTRRPSPGRTAPGRAGPGPRRCSTSCTWGPSRRRAASRGWRGAWTTWRTWA